MISHHCTSFPSILEFFIDINTSCLDENLKSKFQVRAPLAFFFIFDALKMSEAPAARDKRWSTGACASGLFGDFYENPDPNIRRRIWQRIFGTVQGACSPRKYRVLFDCGKVVECFSNTLCVEMSTSSVPSEELQIAISQAERGAGESVTPIAAAIVADNEAAANDADIDEHLPGSPE